MSEKLETMTPELKAFVDEWKSKPGNLIMVLHRVQQTYGYIPRNIALDISQMLDVPLAKIYGVVTFYNFFRLQKAGKYNVQVCLGTACYLSRLSREDIRRLHPQQAVPAGSRRLCDAFRGPRSVVDVVEVGFPRVAAGERTEKP